MRMVEEFLVIFRNHGPVLHAIVALTSRAIERSPKLFESVQRGGIGCREAGSKSGFSALGEHHTLLADETTDANCAAVFGKALRVLR